MYAGYPALNADIAMEGGVYARLSGTFVARGWQTIQKGLITLTGSDGTLRLNEKGTVTIFKTGTESNVPLVPCPEGDCDRTLSDVLAAIRSGDHPPTSLADNLKTFAMVVAAELACVTGQNSKIRMEF
ncbi:MAG: hypothetical protein AB7G08_18310 [Hyphomicrobiaceae bacterium]